MDNKIRSEYIKNLVSEKDALKKKLDEMANESLKDIVSEEVNKNLRKLISEADENDDSYEEEEVEDIPTPDTDKEGTDGDSVETGDDASDDLPAVEDDAETISGEEDGDVETDDDMWGDLEQYKDETGEFDLRNMDKDNVVKVLKLVAQDPSNSVRVFKDDAQGTIVVNDDETEKQYVIDIETADNADGVEVSTETTDESKCGEGCNESEDKCSDCGKDKKDCTCEDNKVNEETGYTTDYQKETAMTTPSNNEPAKSSETYSMDGGVPTGTEKPYGKADNEMNPFEENVNENDEFEIEVDDNVEEATNVGGFANQNSTAKSHVPNSDGRAARNQSKGGEYTSTQKPRYSGEQMESIKRQANQIFAENKQLKGIVEELKNKINEAIVANYNLSRIIKLVTENSTSKEEKMGIINKFNNVRTLQEAKDTFTAIDAELKNPDRVAKINNLLDKQLSESKTNNATKPVVETKMYQSEDLQETISLMARLDALDKNPKKK